MWNKRYKSNVHCSVGCEEAMCNTALRLALTDCGHCDSCRPITRVLLCDGCVHPCAQRTMARVPRQNTQKERRAVLENLKKSVRRQSVDFGQLDQVTRQAREGGGAKVSMRDEGRGCA